MRTAATKWKEFKAELKKVYDDDMEDDELYALCDPRVHMDDWKWLVNHLRILEAAVSYKLLAHFHNVYGGETNCLINMT
jgi:hypothetical protein